MYSNLIQGILSKASEILFFVWDEYQFTIKPNGMHYTLFFIRTTKFCPGSLFLIFWLLQPQFVLNFVLISVSGLKWEINTDRLYFKQICSFIQDYLPLCILSSLAVLAHRLQRLNFLLPNDFIRFSEVSTWNIFTFFSLTLSFFLNCS